MDQDSSFREADITQHLMTSLQVMADQSIAVVSPVFTSHVNLNVRTELFEADSSITSGSVLRLTAWQLVGGLKSKFFMDQIDHEFCIRLRREGYKVIVNPQAYMSHSIGNPITKILR